jgi:hypothetical protein
MTLDKTRDDKKGKCEDLSSVEPRILQIKAGTFKKSYLS